MNFLNPSLLFAMAAAVLPLVIHLLSRKRAKVVVFPSIEFLERMKTDRMRRLKMKQILVLLLRTMIVAMIVFAFARPAINSVFQLNARTAVVIVIDNSAGMQYVYNGERLSEIARRRADEILAMLDKSDQAAVIVANRDPLLLGGELGDPRELADKLDDISISWDGSDAYGSFRLAAELLSDATVTNRECYYITDGDQSAIPDSIPGMPENTRLYIVHVVPDGNTGSVLTGLRLNSRIVSPASPVTFTASGKTNPMNGETGVEFFIDGERKGRIPISAAPGAPFAVEFTYTPERTGWYSVSAVVTDERFPEAGIRRLTMNAPLRTEVLVIGDTPADLFFPGRVLDIGGQNTAFRTRTVLSANLQAGDFSGADVIVLSGVANLDQSLYRSLVTSVTGQGAGLIIFMPREPDSSLYAEGVFRMLFPARVENRIVRSGESGTYTVIDRFDLEHPVMRGVIQGNTFTKPEAYSWHRITPDTDVNVLARFADGSMAIGETAAGIGRVAVFGISLSAGDSDLPLTGIFVPLILQSVQYLSGNVITGGQYEAGENVRETVQTLSDTAVMAVKPEDSPARQVDFTRKGGQYILNGRYADEPGFYSIIADGLEISRYSVDIPADEAEFRRTEPQQLATAFDGVTWKALEGGSAIQHAVEADRYGAELFSFALMGAFLLIAVEMLVSRKV